MTEAEWLSSEDPHALLKYVAQPPRSWALRVACLLGMGSDRGIERKTRLFAIACCRRVWHLLVDPRFCAAIVVYERYLDGLADNNEWQQVLAAERAAVVEAAGPRLALGSWTAAAQARAAEAVSCAVGPGDPALEAAALCREAVRALAKNVPVETPKQAAPAPNSSWVSDVGSWSNLQVSPPSSSSSSSINLQQSEAAAQAAWSTERRVQASLVRDIFGNPFKTAAISRAWAGSAVADLAQAIYVKNSFERLPELAKALEQSGCASADLLTHCRAAGDHVRGCWAVDAVLGKAL